LLLTTEENPKKGLRDGLYVTTLWGWGGGLGAHPEDVPIIREPEEKELCAGPSVALGHDDGTGRCGAVLPGGLQLGSPASADALTTTTTPHSAWGTEVCSFGDRIEKIKYSYFIFSHSMVCKGALGVAIPGHQNGPGMTAYMDSVKVESVRP
jgi:hypothetical protein